MIEGERGSGSRGRRELIVKAQEQGVRILAALATRSRKRRLPRVDAVFTQRLNG